MEKKIFPKTEIIKCIRLNTNQNLFLVSFIEWKTDRLLIITNSIDLLSFWNPDSKQKDFLYLVFKTLITTNASIDFLDGILNVSHWNDSFFTIYSIHYYYDTFEEIWNDFKMTHELILLTVFCPQIISVCAIAPNINNTGLCLCTVQYAFEILNSVLLHQSGQFRFDRGRTRERD